MTDKKTTTIKTTTKLLNQEDNLKMKMMGHCKEDNCSKDNSDTDNTDEEDPPPLEKSYASMTAKTPEKKKEDPPKNLKLHQKDYEKKKTVKAIREFIPATMKVSPEFFPKTAYTPMKEDETNNEMDQTGSWRIMKNLNKIRIIISEDTRGKDRVKRKRE